MKRQKKNQKETRNPNLKRTRNPKNHAAWKEPAADSTDLSDVSQDISHNLSRSDIGTAAGTGIPMEDRALKEAARFMGQELLPLLGVAGRVRRPAPTEAVFLEVKDFLADFNYEMDDSTWLHLEFESDSLSVEDLRRFRACEAVISHKYQVTVSTCVLCTSRVKHLRSSLTEGMNTYQVKVVRMKDRNADEIIQRLEAKQTAGENLEREELLEVLLTSLMDGEMDQTVRIKRSFKILQREQDNLNREELVPMQSVLYALAMKVLTKEEIKQVKEMMTMTILGQMLMEEGIERGMKQGLEQGIVQGISQGISKGIEQGEFKTMQELIRDGILTIETAASRKHMTVDEFQKKLTELGLV